ncbi:hypothetical protein FXO38_20829 [Capsicum annuum]|uniref:Uncharacterized protein n=1 Tax=Capsicum annuum TaxID=4072 RepID=A0A2G3AHN9_CAPAN|nr:hypothetical protein FXO38_20829 [Capsicum annuum]PHT93761.1 hypothetical protein T459_01643 [Capsicum annuum]
MVLQNKSDGCESRFIQEIVKVVAGNLNRVVLSVALHPIGIDSQVDIMAIYGIGGIERHNGLVSLQNEIEEILDHLRRIKSGGDLDSFKIDQIEKLKMDLKLLRTFVKYSYFLWSNSVVKITKKARRIVKMLCGDFIGIPDECKTNLDLKRLESQLLKVIDVDAAESEDDIFNKPPYLLCLIVLVELEMKKIFLGELQASKFTQSKIFKDKKLPKGFFTSSPQFADKKVTAIAGDVLYVIQKLLPGSIDEDETSGTGDIYSMRVLEKTKDLKVLKSKSDLDFLMKPLFDNLER